MKEKLIIRNFGPIKSVELDIRRVNVLIGEQATGKSTIAKVLAICRYFSYIIQNDQRQQPFEEGLSSWGLSESIQEDTFIQYECAHYSFSISNKISTETDHDPEGIPYEYKRRIFFSSLTPKTREFTHLLAELEKIKPEPESKFIYVLGDDYGWRIPTSFFQNDVASVIDNPFYLPAERGLQSIFSLGKSSIQNISDSLFNQFAELNKISLAFSDHTRIEPLGIEYRIENGKGRIRKIGENRYFNLSNAASGFQSTVPVVLLMKFYNEIRKKKKTFIIEEPELNLFPSAQNELVKFIIENVINFKNNILLTTHSPYILTSLNNLMYANHVGKIKHNEAQSIVNEKYWLNSDDVSAYLLLSNGTNEDIMDRKEGMIKADTIDEISRKLNAEFDKLQDAELNIKN